MDLATLALRHALIDSFNRYAEGLDSKQWDMVRRCFSDRVRLEYGPLSEEQASADGNWAADDWIAALQSVINGFDITRHTITNHRFDFREGRVNCRAYLSADHVIFPQEGLPGPENIWTFVGEYSNHYERSAEGDWTICRSALVTHWTSGNADLYAVAQERAAAQANSKP